MADFVETDQRLTQTHRMNSQIPNGSDGQVIGTIENKERERERENEMTKCKTFHLK